MPNEPPIIFPQVIPPSPYENALDHWEQFHRRCIGVGNATPDKEVLKKCFNPLEAPEGYEALPVRLSGGQGHSCRGCVFRETGHKAEAGAKYCGNAARCHAKDRQDGQDVIYRHLNSIL